MHENWSTLKPCSVYFLLHYTGNYITAATYKGGSKFSYKNLLQYFNTVYFLFLLPKQSLNLCCNKYTDMHLLVVRQHRHGQDMHVFFVPAVVRLAFNATPSELVGEWSNYCSMNLPKLQKYKLPINLRAY